MHTFVNKQKINIVNENVNMVASESVKKVEVNRKGQDKWIQTHDLSSRKRCPLSHPRMQT
jgi:hypothetical protein